LYFQIVEGLSKELSMNSHGILRIYAINNMLAQQQTNFPQDIQYIKLIGTHLGITVTKQQLRFDS